MTAAAAVMFDIDRPLEVRAIDVAPPGPHEVAVRTAASGVCHSDLTTHNGTATRLPLPMVLGHEGAGVVEAIGEGSKDSFPAITSSLPRCRNAGSASGAAKVSRRCAPRS